MALHFDKYAQETNVFIKNLAKKLGHPDELNKTERLLKAVLHALRDRITIQESLDMIAQLPMLLKAIYVENWSYTEKPLRLQTMEEFTQYVEKKQHQYGEQDFDWKKSTAELIKIVIGELHANYISTGEIQDIIDQLPVELKSLFLERI